MITQKTLMKTIFLSSLLVLQGCAHYESALVNPSTNQIYRCNSSGYGWLGTPVAVAEHYACVRRAREKGYTS